MTAKKKSGTKPEPEMTHHDEVYRPMGATEPTINEKIEALVIRVQELERWKDNADRFISHVARDHSYRIGGKA